MKLVILAGGFGTRISEETDIIPKPMVKIGSKPIIWHIMKYYSLFNVSEFVICGGYKVNVIREYFKNLNDPSFKDVKVINTGKNSNTGERLRRVKKFVGDTFFLTYGDGLSNVNLDKLLNFHQNKKSIVSLTAVKPIPHFGKLVLSRDMVIKFSEKDPKKENWINGGFFVCDKAIFKYLNKTNCILESHTLDLLSKKKKLFSYKHNDFWYCMDTLRDKRYLNLLWKNKNTPWTKKNVK